MIVKPAGIDGTKLRHYTVRPSYSKGKAMLERVQHLFTIGSSLSWESWLMTYEARLKALKPWSLGERRNRAELIEVYKLMHGFTDIPMSTDCYWLLHTKEIVKSHCHTDARLCFFSLRVINRWNSLSQEIVDAPSANAFKRHLQSLGQKMDNYFIDSYCPHKPFWLLVMQDTVVVCRFSW